MRKEELRNILQFGLNENGFCFEIPNSKIDRILAFYFNKMSEYRYFEIWPNELNPFEQASCLIEALCQEKLINKGTKKNLQVAFTSALKMCTEILKQEGKAIDLTTFPKTNKKKWQTYKSTFVHSRGTSFNKVKHIKEDSQTLEAIYSMIVEEEKQHKDVVAKKSDITADTITLALLQAINKYATTKYTPSALQDLSIEIYKEYQQNRIQYNLLNDQALTVSDKMGLLAYSILEQPLKGNTYEKAFLTYTTTVLVFDQEYSKPKREKFIETVFTRYGDDLSRCYGYMEYFNRYYSNTKQKYKRKVKTK